MRITITMSKGTKVSLVCMCIAFLVLAILYWVATGHSPLELFGNVVLGFGYILVVGFGLPILVALILIKLGYGKS